MTSARYQGRRIGPIQQAGQTAGLLGLAVLPMLLACCASPHLDPIAVAQDRSGTSLLPPGSAMPVPDFGGYYAGLWVAVHDGSCAQLAAVPRDMLVEPSGAASGVNYPLRGVVRPDGWVSLAYGKAAVVGRFGPDGFVGHANSGDGCSWLVNMTRQPLIGRPPGVGSLPGATVVQGDVPDAPDQALRPGQRFERR